MNIVLDTNVIVAGLLSPEGTCRRVLDSVLRREAEVIIDDGIMDEYRAVLARPRFNLDADEVAAVVDFIGVFGRRVLRFPVTERLPDQTDQMFLECALSGEADYIVTGNNRHFPAGACHRIPVLSPAEFLDAVKGI